LTHKKNACQRNKGHRRNPIGPAFTLGRRNVLLGQ
jgi:hypothetical protein